jgi:sugar transferase (PEP-CTERM/EpsH1 system associated)
LNILFVSATVPYPAIDGGRIRVLNLVSRLAKRHRITFLTFNALPSDMGGIQHLRDRNVEVAEIRWKAGKAKMALRYLLQGFIHKKPLTVAKYYDVEMAKKLENLLEKGNYQVIHFEMLHTGQFISYLEKRDVLPSKSFATVLGEQNIDSNIWYRLAKEESSPLRKLIFHSQYKSFMGYEKRICHHFDLCTCVSDQDRDTLASICPSAAIEVVPNGVDPGYFKLFDSEEEDNNIIFTGSMDWQPNEDAVLYFCDRILPIIKAELPDIKFYIVGSNPTHRVEKLGGRDDVIVTGFVEDVRPYIAKAAVFIVPLRIGSGTRLKILQALAMEKAVVSTSIGCEGLDIIPGKHLLVADRTEKFAEFTIQLVKNRETRRELGENGGRIVRERYDWDAIARNLENMYEKIALQKAK